MLQIDALSYAELRRAIELGYCPTISQMVREEGYTLRRWFCGLPSATPYCQAGIFYGENEGIPAFRFYDKAERRVITCNTPSGVQYIRDRIHAPGALAGGSSYVNLLDGDAQTVALHRRDARTDVGLSATRRLAHGDAHRSSIRFAWLRMGLQAVLEWLREEYERTVGRVRAQADAQRGVVSVHPHSRATSSFASCRRWRSCSTSTSACRSSTARSCSTTSSAITSGRRAFRRYAIFAEPTRAFAKFVA